MIATATTDPAKRGRAEDDLARALRKLNNEHSRRLVGLLGNPPDISRITEAHWLEIEREIDDVLRAELAAIFLLMADDALSGDSSFVRLQAETRIAREAEAWSRSHGRAVAREMTTHTRQRLADAVVEARAPLVTAPGGEPVAPEFNTDAIVDGVLSDARTLTAAITETTRATTHARLTAAALRDSILGIVTVAYWVTEEDDRVCAICWPLNDEPEVIWSMVVPGGPPAHPNCRCDLVWREEG